MWLAAARTLERVAELGERAGVTFCLENLNTAVDHPGVPFARAADTLALVEAVDRPGLRMMLDLYHAQIGEGNLIELLRRAGPLIGEVQVADVPGRCEPGTGEINYPAIAGALDELGYRGTVGLEAWASGDSEQALARFRDGLHPPRHPDRSAPMTTNDPIPGAGCRRRHDGWRRARRGRGHRGLPRREPGLAGAGGAAGRDRRPGARGGRAAGRAARLRAGHHRPGRAARRPLGPGGGDRRPRPLPRRAGDGGRRRRQGGVLREAHGGHPGRRRPGRRRRRGGRGAAPGGLQPALRRRASGPPTTWSPPAASAPPSCCAR